MSGGTGIVSVPPMPFGTSTIAVARAQRDRVHGDAPGRGVTGRVERLERARGVLAVAQEHGGDERRLRGRRPFGCRGRLGRRRRRRRGRARPRRRLDARWSPWPGRPPRATGRSRRPAPCRRRPAGRRARRGPGPGRWSAAMTRRASVENATRPTRNRSGRLATKSDAAALAAVRRSGATSVASIERDVSIVEHDRRLLARRRERPSTGGRARCPGRRSRRGRGPAGRGAASAGRRGTRFSSRATLVNRTT